MRPPRRIPRKQIIRRRIFVGCEGEGERSYIRLVSSILNTVHQKVHLDPHPLQPGGGDPLALVRRAGEIIRQIERTREPYVEKYVLIDRDGYGRSPDRDHQMQVTVERIGATIIWQRPAREGFLLRHLPGCSAHQPTTTQVAMQALVREWPEYRKNMSAIELATRIDIEALQRAAIVEDELRAFLVAIEMF